MTPRPLNVVIAPDSYKGTLSAASAADALASGWAAVRRSDDVVTRPQADGGEGTIDAFQSSVQGAVTHTAHAVRGPGGRLVDARWLELPDGTAVVELAESSGLPLLAEPDPLGSTTRGVGQVMRIAIESGARRVIVGLGGSASTDGGSGALVGLGARLLDRFDRPLPDGGGHLRDLVRLDLSEMVEPPVGGVLVLHDTDVSLLGPTGAAQVFGPQKGADPEIVAALDRSMDHWATCLARHRRVDRDQKGAGSAGGAGFGLAAWGATLVPGADAIAEMTGLATVLAGADVVVTGEGQFDITSRRGKLVGNLLDRATRHGVKSVVVAGRVVVTVPDVMLFDLTEIAGSSAAAMNDTPHWLGVAAALAASATDLT